MLLLGNKQGLTTLLGSAICAGGDRLVLFLLARHEGLLLVILVGHGDGDKAEV